MYLPDFAHDHWKPALATIGAVLSTIGAAFIAALKDIDPNELDKMPINGVLLAFIIVLASCIGWMVRYYVRERDKREKQYADLAMEMKLVVMNNTSVIGGHKSELERVNEFWDSLGKDAMKASFQHNHWLQAPATPHPNAASS